MTGEERGLANGLSGGKALALCGGRCTVRGAEQTMEARLAHMAMCRLRSLTAPLHPTVPSDMLTAPVWCVQEP